MADPLSDKPNIAVFLATSGHSGVDRIMKNLIPALAERGLRIDLLKVRRHGPDLDAKHPNIRIVDLGNRHVYSCLIPLLRYLRRKRPQVLFSDKDRVNRIALLAAKIANTDTRVAVRVGTTVSRDLAVRSRWDRWQHYLSMHHLYCGADAIIVPSRGAAADLAAFAGLPRERISVVPSPVVTPDLAVRGRQLVSHPWLNPKREPVVLGVGELSDRKNYASLIRAFRSVRKQMPSKLIILGEGKRRPQLEQLVTELNLGRHVSLPGFVDNPYAFMSAADVYAHSSILEGSPVALMEALAFGLPVVSTDCPSGPREVLQNGKYGSLVPVDDPMAMAAAIVAALQHPPERRVQIKASAPYRLDVSTARYLTAFGLSSKKDA